LKDDFEGAEISTLYDVTGDGDAEKLNVDFTIGGNFDSGRGNAVVFGGYSRREALFAGDREFSNVALRASGGQLVPGGSTGVLNGLVEGLLPADQVFTSDGSIRPFQDPEDRFNYAPDNFLQLPQERRLLSSLAHYDLNDNVRAYTEFTFVQNLVDQELAPTPATIRNVTLNPDSPFFGANAQAALNNIRSDTNGDGVINGNDNAVVDTVRRRLRENGSRQVLDTREAFRTLIGLKGDLTDNWSYDAYYSRSSLERTNLLNNDASRSRLIQGLLVTDDGQSCQNPSNGCVPINIFGEGTLNQAAVDYINIGATNITTVVQEVYQASVSGTIGALPSATESVGLVLGLEYREDESDTRPDTFLAAGDVLGFLAGRPTSGSYDASEVFAELSVPLIADRPGIEKLDFWGAYRYSDYSNIGGVSSFATALTYAPVNKATFRVGFQQAVRAPNVSELFLGQTNGFPSATDPCSSGGFQAGVTSVAQCEASGVPAGRVGGFIQSNDQIEGNFGGNPDLEEETSDTFTVGVVFQPTDNLDITLDYFNIEIEDAISVLGGSVNNVLDICFNQVQDSSSAFCQAVSRTGTGQVNTVNVLNENIGAFETSGIDLGISYKSDLDVGFGGQGSNLSVSLKGTYLDKFDITPVSGLDTVFECAGSFGNTCQSEVRNDLIINTRATWTSGDWSFSGLLRYLSSAEDDRIANNDTDPSTLVVPQVSSEVYLDLSARYNFSEDLNVNFGINNVLDTEPTALGAQAEQVNTFPSTYDLLGPRVFFSARYAFR